MKIVYIAGPYTGNAWKVHHNIHRAQAAGLEVAEAGAMPLIPHSNTPACFLDTQDAGFWYDGTMELMRRCDAVLLMDTWGTSTGAIAEKAEAERIGIPVFDTIEGLEEWLA